MTCMAIYGRKQPRCHRGAPRKAKQSRSRAPCQRHPIACRPNRDAVLAGPGAADNSRGHADPAGDPRAAADRHVPGLHARHRVLRPGEGHRGLLRGGHRPPGAQHGAGGRARGRSGSGARRRSAAMPGVAGPVEIVGAPDAPRPAVATRAAADPGRRPRSIAVASGKGGVGKSTVAVNLALALAQLRPQRRAPRRRRLRAERAAHARHRREGTPAARADRLMPAGDARPQRHLDGHVPRRATRRSSGAARWSRSCSRSSSATSTGARSTSWCSTCRPARATRSSRSRSRCRSRAA